MKPVDFAIYSTLLEELKKNNFKVRGNRLLDKRQKTIIDNKQSPSVTSKITNSNSKTLNIFL